MIFKLYRSDFHLVKDIYESNGGVISKYTKYILVKYVDHKIVGLLGFERVPHAGPIWVDESYRQRGYASELISELSNIENEFYTFPSTNASIELFRKNKLTETDWKVFKKEAK